MKPVPAARPRCRQASTPVRRPCCARSSSNMSRPASRSAAARFRGACRITLSPATIRNVMADLTDAGLLFAPHTSAGRLPTDQGLRLFVDGLLQFGEMTDEDREAISGALKASGPQPRGHARPRPRPCCPAFRRPRASCWRRNPTARCATSSSCRSGPGRALVVLVNGDGHVENRIIDTPPGLPPVGVAAGGQLPQRPARRSRTRRGAQRSSRRRWRRTGASWTRCPRKSSRRGWRHGPARGGAAV